MQCHNEKQNLLNVSNMKSLFFLLLIFVALLFFSITPVSAESEFDIYLSDFYQKQEKASKMLKEIETDLKNGSRDRVCARQREAANYGIEATESLIKAFKTDGSTSQMENLEAGLDKWKELRDYC
jgi:predicted RND superfamily exporter protein